MKRYDLDEVKEYPWWAYMRETENGEYYLASEVDARIEALEKALESIAVAPCLYALLGEEPDEPCGCPGCRASNALAANK